MPVCGAAHLTLPLRGPLPLPPKGRRGVFLGQWRLCDTDLVQPSSIPRTALPPAGEGREGAIACFYSRDIGRIWRVAEALEYGIEEFLEVKYLCMGGIDR